MRNLLSLTTIPFLLLAACVPRAQGGIDPGNSPDRPGKIRNKMEKDLSSREPDYADLTYWASHPFKDDPADSVSPALREKYTYDTTAVVFFVHPTTLTGIHDERWNAEILDPYLVQKTDQGTIRLQASVFNEFPLYAPRYRQAHIRSYYTRDTISSKQAFELAYQDIKKAFEYFLAANPGKPFFIASHSQGSTHTIRLLKELIDAKPLKERMIAAYIIGMGIPDQYTELEMCTDSTDTGCIIGWRTFKEGFTPSYVEKENGKPMVTNPLTWDTSSATASSGLNKGAILRNMNRVYPNAADATIHGNILWVNKLDFPASFLVRRRNLHIGDINLFYLNIRENLRTRVQAYKYRKSELGIRN